MALVLSGAPIFDGDVHHTDTAVVIDGGMIAALCPTAELDGVLAAFGPEVERIDLEGGLLAPGFIDAQVNGGGGVMLNDGPTPEAMGAIAAAHRRFGTTGLLPTLITDTPAATAAAIAAAGVAVSTQPGVIGLHLEGPHLAPARKGAHLAELMRPLTEADCDQLIAAAEAIGTLMITVAVEQAPPALIRRLAERGVIVSLGHSDASYAAATAAIEAGARGITHLFNAMSPLAHREPGMVGAALDSGAVWCGIITDGHHVHPAALGAAVRAKRGPGRCFIVTDAMATVGASGDRFVINGREARRDAGRLVLADGTLAGSDIDMAASVRWSVEHLGLEVDEAIRMATVYPASFLKISDVRGRIRPGLAADLVHLGEDLTVRRTWIAGVPSA